MSIFVNLAREKTHYISATPPSDGRVVLGTTWSDTSGSPPVFKICTSLSPITFSTTGSGGTAHNLLSGTHSDTVTNSAVQGDILYANATPAWTRLAAGSAGQVVMVASGVPAWTDVLGALALFDPEPEDGTIVWLVSSPVACTVNSLTHQLGGGSIVITVKINNVNVTGLVDLSPGAKTTTNATGANTVAAGDTITVVCASSSSPTDLALSLKLTRTA